MQKDRSFNFPLITGAFLAAGVLTLLYASREARKYRLERIRVKLNGTHVCGQDAIESGALRKLSILHLSDIHLFAHDVKKIDFLAQITDQDYDLVVLTGDIFEDDDSTEHAFNLLKRKPRIGAFAVLGNHDYFHYDWYDKTLGRFKRNGRNLKPRNVNPLIKALSNAGFQVLQNELVRLPDHKLSIVGIDYPYIKDNQLNELVKPVDSDDLLFALFHLPYNLKAMVQSGVHLAFGGHTHGGQIRVPGVGALWTDSELPGHEASGLICRGNTTFHVSRGLGAGSWTNVRLFCPPAATVLEVEARTASSGVKT